MSLANYKTLTGEEILAEHVRLLHEEANLRRSGRSTNLFEFIERWYISKPDTFSPRKIREIGSLSNEEAEHVITHIQFALLRRRKQAQAVRRVAFRQFYTDATVKRAETKRLVYFKDKLGRPHKRFKSNGQFAEYNAQERQIINKLSTERKQQANKQPEVTDLQ
jgi:hypothetical protein